MRPRPRITIVICLLGAFTTLSGISECSSSDADGDGYTTENGDCNDQSASIYPSSPEVCDGVDNNCNLEIDEGFTKTLFKDGDGDGFGDELVSACAAASGYVTSRGDCRDNDKTTYPGAVDVVGDGLDQDCGGGDGPQPHFALNSRSAASLQAALNSAPTGTVVWVGPGSFPTQDLHFPGTSIQVRSTQLAPKTILDAQSQGRVVRIDSGETSQTLFDGFTLTRGKVFGDNGGCLLVRNASPHLNNLIIDQCHTSNSDPYQALQGVGGGAYFENSDSLLENSIVSNNTSQRSGTTTCTTPSSCNIYAGGGLGAGVFAYGGDITIAWTTIRNNGAIPANGYTIGQYGGGAIGGTMGSLTLSSLTLADNTGTFGSALYLTSEQVLIEDSLLQYNRLPDGSYSGAGGGMFLQDSVADIQRTRVIGNRNANGGGAYVSSTLLHLVDCQLVGNGLGYSGLGGGLLMSNVNLTDTSYTAGLDRVLIAENTAREGGGVWIAGSSDYGISQTSLVNNSALRGGGMYLYDGASPRIQNSIIAQNQAWNVYNDDMFPGNPTFTNTILHNPAGTNHNLGTLGPGAMDIDPKFIASARDQESAEDDYHLIPDSPAIDAGMSGTTDKDGSRADLGFYGGENYDLSYYKDTDSDGLYDGWELHFFAVLDSQTDAADSDGDGLVNGQELFASTRPDRSDTDGDGIQDGLEVSNSSDPLDWYQRPVGSSGTDALGRATARVPGDFPTLDAALSAARSSADIRLTAGEYEGHFAAFGLILHIQGSRVTGETTLVPPNECEEESATYCYTDSVLNLALTTTTLDSLSIVDGHGQYGGNIAITDSTAELLNLTVQRGTAGMGGGLFLTGSSATIQNSVFEGNTCEGYGGGLAAEYSDLNIVDSHFTGNSADYGASIGLANSVPIVSISGTVFDNNFGPGYLTENLNSGDGGALFANPCSAADCSLELYNCTIQNNRLAGGAGIDTFRNISIYNTLFRNNSSSYPILYSENARVLLQNITAINNISSTGKSGIVLKGTSAARLDIRDSILAYSPGYLIYVSSNDGQNPPKITVSNTTLYNSGTSPTHNLTTVPSGLWSFEPGFLSYDANGLPTTAHLAMSSPLLNQGSGTGLDVDGSKPDLGVYGGPLGGSLDQDLDGYPDYFWPGAFSQAPAGTNATAYDASELDAGQH